MAAPKPPGSLLRRYVTQVVRYRVAVIVAAVVLSLFFASQIGNLRVIVDPDRNLPQAHPYVVATKEIERTFGGRHLVVIGVESVTGDIFRPEILAKLVRITDGVLGIPGVIRSNVISLAARKAKDIVGTEEGMVVRQLLETVPETQEEIAALKRAVFANPIYVDSIVSGDSRMALVIADFKFGPELQGYRAIKERVEAVVAPERDGQVRIYLGGISINLAWLEIYSQRMQYLFFGALAIIMVVLYLSFRSFQGMLVPVATAVLSVIWGLGLMGALSIPMDTFNATTPILIMAVAAGHSVQILKRYYEEYGRCPDSPAAVVESLTRIGPVMLTAGSIAVVSFLALTAFPTLTIRIFGVFTAAGILSAMILEMTFIPAFRSLIPAPKRYELERERLRDRLDLFTEALATTITRRGWLRIFGTLGVIALLLVLGLALLVVDNSLKGEFSPNSPVRQDDRALNARMGGTNTIYLLVEGPEPGSIKEPAALEALEATQRHLEERYSLVGKTQSLADFLKRMNKAMHADDPAFDRLPERRDLIAQYLLLYSMSGDPGDFDTYVDYDYRAAVLWAYLKTDSTAYIDRVIQDLRPFVARQFPAGYRVSIGGGMAQGVALNEVMVEGKLLNIGALAGSIYLISSLVLRSPLGGLFVLIPLTLAVLANFGAMGLLGIRLDIGTSATSAMAIGIGADYAIYMIYRLREEVRRQDDPDKALHTALATAGKAVVYVAMAVGLGYSILMVTGFMLHVRLGFLVATAMTVSCLSAIALLTALLYLVRPRFVFADQGTLAEEQGVARSTSLILLGLLVAGSPLSTLSILGAADLSARDIMEKNFFVTKLDHLVNETTMTLTNDKGQQRVRKTQGVSALQPNGIDSKVMIRFLFPGDVQGTAYLQIQHHDGDDDMWIYLPALKKVRRLVANNKKDSFVGSDFSYGDILLPVVDTYRHTLLRTEPLDGEECYVIESVPATEQIKKDYGYLKKISWIRTTNFMEKKVEYFDPNGRHLKTQVVPEVREMDPKKHKWWATRREVVNHQTGHSTLLVFDSLNAEQQIQEDFFTTRYLQREK